MLWLCIKPLAAADKDMFIKDMNLYFEQMVKNKLDVQMNYQLYNGGVSGTPIQNTSINLKLDPINKYINNSQLTMYSNKAFSLVLYKNEKVAVLSKASTQKELTNSLTKLMPDSMFFKYITTVQLLSDTLGLRTYQLAFNKQTEYKQQTIVFDKQNNTIRKSIIYYHDNLIKNFESRGVIRPEDTKVIPVLVIEYKVTVLKEKEDFFLAKNILVKTKTGYQLLAPYSNYKLSNRLKN